MIRRAVAIPLALAAAACGHTHAARNAPGNIDVHRPPAQPADKQVEEPMDPGEQSIVLSGGALGGGGVAFGGDEDTRGAYGVGPELSVGYGVNSRSHHDDPFFIIPERGFGTNLGWTALSGEGSGVGPLYGELYYQETVAWIAAGWVFDPNDHTHGPQLTISTFMLYMRATHQLDAGTQLQAGLSIKLPHAFVWSQ